MARRLYYSLVIVFMCHMPQVAILSLLAVCLAILIFTVTEKPWKDSEMQKLAIANEVFLYLIIVLVLACTSISNPEGAESEILGYLIIGVVTLAIHVNLVAMFAQAWYHMRLLYARHVNSKKPKVSALKAKQGAIANRPSTIPLQVNSGVIDLEAQSSSDKQDSPAGLPHVTENSKEEDSSVQDDNAQF